MSGPASAAGDRAAGGATGTRTGPRPRPSDDRPDPSDRHPAGLDGRLDLSLAERPPPGDRTGRPGPEAVPLPPALPAPSRGRQVRAADRVRQGPARDPGRRRRGPRPAGPAPREGRRRGRPAARADAHPRRQRRVRPPEPLVRAHDPPRSPRPDRGLVDHASASAASPGCSTRSASATGASPALSKRCRELPGQELFQYVGEDGEPRDIASDDVNAYLGAIARDVTAKDFRTWAGTVLAFRALRARAGRERAGEAAQHRAGDPGDAENLGNTPAVARRRTSTRPSSTPISTGGSGPRSSRRQRTRRRRPAGTSPVEEAGVVEVLRQRLELDAGRGRYGARIGSPRWKNAAQRVGREPRALRSARKSLE